MYAVISTGGKQYRVSEGQTIQVERLGADGDVEFTPILVVDGATTIAAADQLNKAKVSGRIIGTASGPKIVGFTYKAKANQHRRWGHRQKYSVLEITGITKG